MLKSTTKSVARDVVNALIPENQTGALITLEKSGANNKSRSTLLSEERASRLNKSEPHKRDHTEAKANSFVENPKLPSSLIKVAPIIQKKKDVIKKIVIQSS
uniref:Uncharacterized protein n=1 Tax=Euplotes harpa TaxID=151035 RepID=A0A7S3JHT1_9SPIT|mmetsp:Transcript_37269/g.42804  ORF Transcript_37269/g.42804 Transcript_37269/m.42804 type:complete len:102 (+) Transcript_37269:122-427(+)